MKRRLIALDLVLALLLVWVGLRFREVHAAARLRDQRTFGRPVPNNKFPPFPVMPQPEPAVAANYLIVADRMLFSKDRNPNVIIDPEPVQQKPPMPPLPVAHGLMMFGDPGIILSEHPGAAQRTYHKGEKVGQFTLVAFDGEKVVLDWNGEEVERSLQELLEKAPVPAESKVAGAAPARVKETAPPETKPLGPGVDLGAGARACQPNDSLPSGTVQDGFRKVEVQTPFGKSCRWDPVR